MLISSTEQIFTIVTSFGSERPRSMLLMDLSLILQSSARSSRLSRLFVRAVRILFPIASKLYIIIPSFAIILLKITSKEQESNLQIMDILRANEM